MLIDMSGAAVAMAVLRRAEAPQLHAEAATFICNLAACIGRDLGSGHLGALRGVLQDETFLRVAAGMLQHTGGQGAPPDSSATCYAAAAANLVMVLHWCALSAVYAGLSFFSTSLASPV